MDVSTPSLSMNPTMYHDALCGSCPSSSTPQTSVLWPTPLSNTGFPAWPGQANQPPQCWSGQPNAQCWPVPQPVPVSYSAPAAATSPVAPPVQTMAPIPALTMAPSPAQTMAPAPPPTQTMAPAPAQMTALAPGQSMVPAPAQATVQAPTSTQVCNPCWPNTPGQITQPQAQAPAPVPAIVPAQPHAASIHPHLPAWSVPHTWPYNPGQSGWPGQGQTILSPQWQPPTSGPLSVPYNLNLARGVYDKMMMTIRGQVKPNAKMFTVNFLKGNDIAFHINPRFSEGGKQVVVRNHKVGERWGPEERDLKGPFPFAHGSPFEMKILCTHEEFRVAVNNMPLFEFKHRVKELNQIDRINILHDVVLSCVLVETLP